MATYFRSYKNGNNSKRIAHMLICVVFALLWANIAHSAHVGFIDDEQSVEVDCSVCHFGGYPPPENLSIPPENTAVIFLETHYQSIHLLESTIDLNAPLRAPPHY